MASSLCSLCALCSKPLEKKCSSSYQVRITDATLSMNVTHWLIFNLPFSPHEYLFDHIIYFLNLMSFDCDLNWCCAPLSPGVMINSLSWILFFAPLWSFVILSQNFRHGCFKPIQTLAMIKRCLQVLCVASKHKNSPSLFQFVGSFLSSGCFTVKGLSYLHVMQINVMVLRMIII